jgi:hypothetical protein
VLVPPALIAGGRLTFPVVSHDSAPWIEFRRLKHQSDSFRSAAAITIGNPSDRLQEESVGVLLSSLYGDIVRSLEWTTYKLDPVFLLRIIVIAVNVARGTS